MKLFIILFVSILILFIGIYFLTPLRYWNPPLAGASGHSKNIAESKERGVFVGKYHPPTNPYIVNDSIKIVVKEAWLEHAWFYSNFSNKSVIDKELHYQICISTDEGSLTGYDKTWSADFITRGSLVLLYGLIALPNTSQEELRIYQGSFEAIQKNQTPLVIGKLILIKDSSE